MKKSIINKKHLIENTFKLYELYGDKGYIGEEVTQLEHAIQCAKLAEVDNEYNKPEIILGAFLHDIGHLLIYDKMENNNNNYKCMGDYGVLNHETTGSDYLYHNNFTDEICSIVKNHINTKRYLITKNKDYYNNLSEGSKQTFKYQNGLMSNREIINFENDPLFKIHLKLREWDDKAKDTSIKYENIKDIINYYKNIAIKLLI